MALCVCCVFVLFCAIAFLFVAFGCLMSVRFIGVVVLFCVLAVLVGRYVFDVLLGSYVCLCVGCCVRVFYVCASAWCCCVL